MNFEKQPDKREVGAEKPRTSERLLLALESTRLNFSKIEMRGEENIGQIPEGAKVVIAVDHKDNLSMPLAAFMLGRKLPIFISNQSTQFSAKDGVIGHLGVALGGKENFSGIDYTSSGKPKPFNPENFTEMEKPLDQGYAALVAAHSPVNNGELPERGGYGAAYLAGITDAYILPVAVNIKSEKPIQQGENQAGILKNIQEGIKLLANRPEAEVSIGIPYKLSESPSILRLQELFEKRNSGARLSKEELQEFKTMRVELENASASIMKNIAEMLPETKRGSWSKEN